MREITQKAYFKNKRGYKASFIFVDRCIPHQKMQVSYT